MYLHDRPWYFARSQWILAEAALSPEPAAAQVVIGILSENERSEKGCVGEGVCL